MRKLSDPFMNDLKNGHLTPLLGRVKMDKDLGLFIRDEYINIYYKGNSLLKLSRRDSGNYVVDIHEKFTRKVSIAQAMDDAAAVQAFIDAIPLLKEAVIQHGGSSLETEYEQLIIRANNRESRINAEYLIVDRQYAIGQDRFDLIGLHWPARNRRGEQRVQPCIIEVKFALNADIKDLDKQIERYYHAVKQAMPAMAREFQGLFRQRIELGLHTVPAERRHAMETLTVADTIDECLFVVLLVDYNPRSSLFDITKMRRLPFRNQVRLMQTGFAMWERNVCAFESFAPKRSFISFIEGCKQERLLQGMLCYLLQRSAFRAAFSRWVGVKGFAPALAVEEVADETNRYDIVLSDADETNRFVIELKLWSKFTSAQVENAAKIDCAIVPAGKMNYVPPTLHARTRTWEELVQWLEESAGDDVAAEIFRGVTAYYDMGQRVSVNEILQECTTWNDGPTYPASAFLEACAGLLSALYPDKLCHRAHSPSRAYFGRYFYNVGRSNADFLWLGYLFNEEVTETRFILQSHKRGAQELEMAVAEGDEWKLFGKGCSHGHPLIEIAPTGNSYVAKDVVNQLLPYFERFLG